jgi:selenocysteine-specific elongation factor
VPEHIKDAGLKGISFPELVIMVNLSEKELDQELQGLLSKKVVVQVDREKRIFLHGDLFEDLKKEALQTLKSFHQANPLKPGMIKEVFKSRLPKGLDIRGFNLLIQSLTKSGSVVQEKELIRLAEHKVALKADQEDVRRRIQNAYSEGKLQPPYLRELTKTIGEGANHMRELVDHMVEEGVLVKVKEELYFDKAVIDSLKAQVISFLRQNGEITTPQFKEMTGTTRKYMIPIIEYFDDIKVTIRVGDVRRLREG